MIRKHSPMRKHHPGGHAKHHDDYLKQYRETGVTHIIGSMRELQARRKNGKEFPVVLGIERITELDGDESDEDLLVAFVRDITQQKRATELEIEIRSAEELLHNMLPAEIAGRLQADPGHLADSHENVSSCRRKVLVFFIFSYFSRLFCSFRLLFYSLISVSTF